MAKFEAPLKSKRIGKARKPTFPTSPRQPLSSKAPLGLLALHLMTAWRKSGRHGLAFLAADDGRAERLGAVLHALDRSCDALVLPSFGPLTAGAFEPPLEISGRRTSVLRRLAEHAKPPFLIATVDAILPRVPPPDVWDRTCLRLAVGQSIGIEELQRSLADLGYDLDTPADDSGGVLFHGKAIELFPAGALAPVRVELSDGKIGAIRRIDPSDRAEAASLAELVVDPMSERCVNGTTAGAPTDIFNYFGDAKVIADAEVPGQAEARWAALDENRANGGERSAFIGRDDWREGVHRMVLLPAASDFETIPKFAQTENAQSALRKFVSDGKRRGARFLFTAGSERDLLQMERLAGIKTLRHAEWATASRTAAGTIISLLIDLEAGFRTGNTRPLLVITATELLGSRARHLQPMARHRIGAAEAETKPMLGNAVIHLQRGLAVLDGLQQVSASDLSAHEMVRLAFADDEAVLVPIAELALIWPYAGDPGGIKLDSADGQGWAARYLEAEREIDRTAQTLSELVRARRQTSAPRLVPPPSEYERFVAGFPYTATPDQSAATEDILSDLASGHPMDRVVCGDVGFGKTEVALRAAAAAVLSGKQVAVVVPTTVLARQHLLTFQQRFARIGVDVGHLSRLVSTADARRIRRQLRDGSLRLVVGTQALAGAEGTFEDLGLVVIDEEQHFGATEKAALSNLRAGVHTLTMSATPIPRTMAGAMAGLRDFSVIATPPARRVPVVTKVMLDLDSTLAIALGREQRRRGQSFVICPRIKDLEGTRERINRAMPDLRVVTVHGRMAAADIDEHMMKFVAGKADVLLATDIVENGLDIPRANTILILSPDRFGLAQLHQLRGRVGRGGTRAFAYLLMDEAGEGAQKRISAFQEFSEPGAGFQISARDLDLRGGGDLLSEDQAGHVRVFGPALYHHLLARALEGRRKSAVDFWIPDLHVDVPELLPFSYIPDEATRLDIYERLGKSETRSEINDIEDETQDRFGILPQEVSSLFTLAIIRLDCMALGIQRIDVGPVGIAAKLKSNASTMFRSPSINRTKDRLILKRKVTDSQKLPALVEFIELLKQALGVSGRQSGQPKIRLRKAKPSLAP